MTCSKCGCFIPSRFEHCPACDQHKSLTTEGYDVVKFEIWGVEYQCRITMMRENKDGSVSFNMKTT
jgi:hypothetical protein